jgi:hypothetical protein|tara:strand:+ start:564 stop:761 length:198 start_codon:yes stop_codon:yes gene_type:complete
MSETLAGIGSDNLLAALPPEIGELTNLTELLGCRINLSGSITVPFGRYFPKGHRSTMAVALFTLG